MKQATMLFSDPSDLCLVLVIRHSEEEGCGRA